MSSSPTNSDTQTTQKKRTNESWGDKAVKLIGNFILFHFHISHQKWCQGFFFFNLKQKNENCLWNYRSLLLGGLVNVKSMICGLTECCPSIWIPSDKSLQIHNKSLQIKSHHFLQKFIDVENYLKNEPLHNKSLRISISMNTFRWKSLWWLIKYLQEEIPSGINPFRNKSLQNKYLQE